MIKTARQALATHWGIDFADVPDYHYTAILYNIPVYAIGNDYFCASKKSPAKEIGMNITDELQWSEVKDEFVNKEGWKIFKATV